MITLGQIIWYIITDLVITTPSARMQSATTFLCTSASVESRMWRWHKEHSRWLHHQDHHHWSHHQDHHHWSHHQDHHHWSHHQDHYHLSITRVFKILPKYSVPLWVPDTKNIRALNTTSNTTRVLFGVWTVVLGMIIFKSPNPTRVLSGRSTRLSITVVDLNGAPTTGDQDHHCQNQDHLCQDKDHSCQDQDHTCQD